LIELGVRDRLVVGEACEPQRVVVAAHGNTQHATRQDRERHCARNKARPGGRSTAAEYPDRPDDGERQRADQKAA
jgi:hypothetical protein